MLEVEVPPSKSITHRALVISALALGNSVIKNPLLCDDTIYTMEALRKLGVDIRREGERIYVKGTNGRINPPEEKTEIYVGNSGTSARFLTAFASLAKKDVLITGDKRLKERPMEDLLQVLFKVGIGLKFLEKKWHIPFIIRGPLIGGTFLLPKAESSQFVSALIIVGPCLKYGMELLIKEIPVSGSYIRLTLEVMRKFGMNYRVSSDLRWYRFPYHPYMGREFSVEPDASSAAYFWAAAAVTGEEIKVKGLKRSSNQPDIKFLDVLEKMGCTVEEEDDGIKVKGGELEGIEIDMNNMPDQVPTLAVISLFAKGKTHIFNVPHLRGKESDRLKAMATEIRKLGGKVEEKEDGLIIEGGKKLHGAQIETYNDHRIAMSFAVAKLKVKDIEIKGKECVSKSFPNFWEVWERVFYGKDKT